MYPFTLLGYGIRSFVPVPVCTNCRLMSKQTIEEEEEENEVMNFHINHIATAVNSSMNLQNCTLLIYRSHVCA